MDKVKIEVHYMRPDGSKDYLIVYSQIEAKKCIKELKAKGYANFYTV